MATTTQRFMFVAPYPASFLLIPFLTQLLVPRVISQRLDLPPTLRPIMNSAMDQNRNLAMRGHLHCFAPEDNGCDTMSSVRRHQDKIAAFGLSSIDDRLIRMLMLDVERLT